VNLLAWCLVALSQIALVVGQLFLKHAMTRRENPAPLQRGWIGQLTLGIVALTVWFLLWLGVMHRVELSKLMPLEGLSPLLIVFAAMIFLGEHLTWRGWTGVALTSLGVALVSAS
jgi:drug/metabolite transporter (DMT)-like permease